MTMLNVRGTRPSCPSGSNAETTRIDSYTIAYTGKCLPVQGPSGTPPTCPAGQVPETFAPPDGRGVRYTGHCISKIASLVGGGNRCGTGRRCPSQPIPGFTPPVGPGPRVDQAAVKRALERVRNGQLSLVFDDGPTTAAYVASMWPNDFLKLVTGDYAIYAAQPNKYGKDYLARHVINSFQAWGEGGIGHRQWLGEEFSKVGVPDNLLVSWGYDTNWRLKKAGHKVIGVGGYLLMAGVIWLPVIAVGGAVTYAIVKKRNR